MKSKIKARFGKLSDESIESLKGNLEPLSSKLQSAYGYAREQADKESAGFKTSLHLVKNEGDRTSSSENRSSSNEDRSSSNTDSKSSSDNVNSKK